MVEFLNVLATQAAVVIDDAMLFEELRHANVELMTAYDRTIEGWSRALDLRDKGDRGTFPACDRYDRESGRGYGH